MIRPSLRNEILKLLNRPPVLLSEDFCVETTDVHTGIEFVINYVVGDGQFYKATIPNAKRNNDDLHTGEDFRIQAICNPGELTAGERQEFWGSRALLRSIEAWASRLFEDILNSPVARALSDQEVRLAQLESQLEGIPDEYVTVEQAKRAKAYLDQVEAELRSRIEALEKDAPEKTRRIEELHAEFELLRQRVETTKLRRIVRAAAFRFYRIASDPKLGALIENGKKIVGLLGDGK